MKFPIAFLTIGAILTSFSGCESAYSPNSTSQNSNPPAASTRSTSSPETIPASSNDHSKIGQPTPQLSPLPPDAKGVQAAIDLIHKYYKAINARDYRTAYELWSGSGEASEQSFEQFRDGFANTAEVEIDTSGEPGDFEGAAGSQYVSIPLLIKAKTKDGKEQNFWGQYVLRRSFVEGAEARGEWRIHSAEFREQ